MPHRGVGACGERQSSGDGLIGSDADVFEASRCNSRKGKIVEAVDSVDGDGACGCAGERDVLEGLIIST